VFRFGQVAPAADSRGRKRASSNCRRHRARLRRRAAQLGVLRAWSARGVHLRRGRRRGWTWRCCRGRTRRGSPPPAASRQHGRRPAGGQTHRRTVKRIHCGWAARCGVAAADLARHGLTGPPTVLEGRFGSAATGPTRTPSSAAWARTGRCRAWFQAVPVQPRHPGGRGRRPAAARPGGSPQPTSQRSSWASPSPSCARSPTPEAKARPPGTSRRSAAPTRPPRRCSAAASASHEDFTDAAARDPRASPWPLRCAASRTSAAARRSSMPSPPSCA
jgi:hypothetical protein